jgi:plasmid stabilization system protein ParE
MRLAFHPRVASDISQIMRYYAEMAGAEFAEEFYSELRSCFAKAAKTPQAYAVRVRDLRRVNLNRFPYHFFFRIVQDCVRVLVVRHHNRHPSLGLQRQ